MQYLLKEITIYEGTNSRGKYHWMSATLFNDKNVRMNSERKVYYSTSEDECSLYLPYAKEDPQNKGSFIVNMADLRAALKDPNSPIYPYGEQTILYANVVKVKWPLSKPFGRIYRNNVVDPQTKAITHTKGEFIKSETGQIMEYRELSFYLAMDIDPDDNTTMYSDDPQRVANRILERYYKPLSAEQSHTPTANPAPEAPLSQEEKEAKLAELKAQLGL